VLLGDFLPVGSLNLNRRCDALSRMFFTMLADSECPLCQGVTNSLSQRLVAQCIGYWAKCIFTVLVVVCSSESIMAQAAVAPAITSQPSSQTLVSDSVLQLYVVATGTPPLRYQWQKNGSAISGGSDGLFGISHVQVGDAGTYSVVVSNSAGSVTSNGAVVTVKNVSVLTSPTDQTVVAGGTATFSVSVSSTDPVTYQWQGDRGPIAGATSSTLTIPNVQASNAGGYNVLVSSAYTAALSRSAFLTVLSPPAFTQQPTSQATWVVGGGGSFSVYVSGSDPFSFQWYKNGTAIPGATSNSFGVGHPVQQSDAGTYWVVVTNGQGSITSRSVTVSTVSLSLVGSLSKTYDGLPLNVSVVTDPPGLPLRFLYSGPRSLLTGPPVDAGLYSVVVSVNSAQYAGASIIGSLQILPAPATITFAGLQQVYTGAPRAVTATLNPTGASIPVEYGGTNGPPPINAGTYSVAIVGGFIDSNYVVSQSPGTATLVVAKADQTVTFNQLPSGLAVGAAFSLAASASSSLPVTFSVVSGNATLSGNNLIVNDPSNVTIRGTQSGDSNYNPASADLSFAIGKQNQSITFGTPTNQLISAAPFALSATTSSGLPVSFSIVSGPATVSGNTITLAGTTGTVVVRASQAGNGSYNAAPFVDRSFSVTTVAPPVITVQPVGQTVGYDETATFSVVATGAGPLSYVWLRNGIPINSAGVSTFGFYRVEPDMTGSISVVVSNAGGSVTSNSVTLAIGPSIVAPTIAVSPVSQTVSVSSTGSFTVSATGTQPLYYQWRKDGVAIAGATNSTLALSNVQVADAGSYTVVVTNAAGSATSVAASLTISTGSTGSAPVVTIPPSGVVVAQGANAVFAVTASGTAPLSYQWRKDGVPISGATSATLTVTNAQTSNAGSYSVSISNAFGSVVSGTATLTVASPPVITAQPVSRAASAGDSVTLSVTAVATSGSQAPTFQWQCNGSNVVGAISQQLAIDNVQPAKAGLYAAAVTSGATTLTDAAIVGVATTSEAIGAATVLQPTRILHPNGNYFDQILLTGTAETITAVPSQVARTSFIDLNDDIVQVEFSGAGTLSLVLDNATGPATPVNYNQPGTSYMKGHAGIVITGADETSNLSVFTVGRATAFDLTGAFNILLPIGSTNDPTNNGSSLFQGHAATAYDGIADIAFIAISSTNGKFGNLRAANANCFATKGLTGIYAPGVQFVGPVYVSDINASDVASAVFVIGSSPDTRITGGDLLQANGQPMQVGGITQLKFTAGTDSNGKPLSAKNNRAVLQQNGADVTGQIVVNPTP
jgi:hypothetical protein